MTASRDQWLTSTMSSCSRRSGSPETLISGSLPSTIVNAIALGASVHPEPTQDPPGRRSARVVPLVRRRTTRLRLRRPLFGLAQRAHPQCGRRRGAARRWGRATTTSPRSHRRVRAARNTSTTSRDVRGRPRARQPCLARGAGLDSRAGVSPRATGRRCRRISSKGTENTSCSTNATRSRVQAGRARRGSAAPTESAVSA